MYVGCVLESGIGYREPTWFELYERLHGPKGKPNE